MTLIGDQELARRLGAAGRVTGAQLTDCLGELMQRRARGETPTLRDLLLERGLVTNADLNRVTGRIKVPKLPRMPRVGDRLCGYQVVRQLGSGNMGAVYLGRGEKGSVAIKVLHGGQGASELRKERFEREAAALSGLDHPGIVRLISAQLHGELPCLIFEYVPGQTLGEVFATPSLPHEDKLGLLVQVSRAVDLAHRKGIVHRDLKPENVLVCGGIAKVADFGIARDLERETRLTETGGIVGSPNYMAPEQVSSGEITPRTDVYAIGVLLYELLTGEVPFRAATPVELYQLIMGARVTPPSRISGAADGRHDAVCLRALARDPARRYPSAAALAEAIDGLRAPAPARSSPGALAVVALTLGLALLLLVPLALLLGASLVADDPPEQSPPAWPATASTVDPPPATEDPPAPPAEVDREEVQRLTQLGLARVRQGDEEGGLKTWKTALDLDPEDAKLWRACARLHQERGELQSALANYDQALRIDPKDAIALSYRANVRFALKQFVEAVADYTGALELRPRDARNLFNRGNARFEAGDPAGAIEDYTRALRLDEDVPKQVLYRARGLAHRKAGDAEAAITDFERYLRLGPSPTAANQVRHYLAELRGLSKPSR